MMAAKAIAFDAYGTLCFMGTSTHPYRELLEFLPISPANLRQELMTQNHSLEKVTARYGAHNPELVAKLKDLIQEEVESVRPYPEVIDTLKVLVILVCKLFALCGQIPQYRLSKTNTAFAI